MKILIMCEGPNELEIVRILLENDCFSFTEEDLLNLTPYHARQIKSSTAVKTALNIYPENDVVVYRIGDKQNEKLKIPEEYKDKIQRIEKYCTKPELEMLLIISEGLTDDFEKVKSRISPKDFAKAKIIFGGKRYNNSTKFYKDYYSGRVDLLIDSIKEYKRIKSHANLELYLADLLK